MSLELCHPASPRRVVDWRWRSATCLRQGLLPVHCGWVDAWVERAVAFWEALDDCDGDPHHPRLAEQDPVLSAAYELRLEDGRRTRWHVEALLLAGEGDDSVEDIAVVGPAAPQGRHARLRRPVLAALTVELAGRPHGGWTR